MAEKALAFGFPRQSVKVCGLREPRHAQAAVTAGADLLGFVFAPSKRRVDAVTARACIEAARGVTGERRFLAVGVFASATAEEMNETAERAGLDLLQVHGNADATIGNRLRRPYLVAVHPSPEMSASDVEAVFDAYRRSAAPPLAFLIDGYRVGQLGGQGVRADWNLARELARCRPVVLAGGLNAENVGEAIRTVGPIGVDVSSGVETEGSKDGAKIGAFVRAAREGFAASNR